METLELNVPLRTTGPEVRVDPRLPAGRYVASLTVTSDRGESRVATLRFTVQATPSVAHQVGEATSGTRRPR